MATIEDIKNKAEQIKNATAVGENTAERVGGVLTDIAEYLGDDISLTKTLSYDQLDTLGFDQLTTENISNLEEQAANGAPLRYHVSPSANGLPEGVLEVWLDSMAHVVVEKITTSAVLDASSQQFTGAHTDFTQSTYIRYLNINAPSSPVGQLQWTKWQIYESTNTTGYRYALLLPDNPPTTSEKVFGLIDGGTVGKTLPKYLDPTGKPVEIEANTIGLLLSQWDRTKQENRWLKGTFPASRAGIAIKNIKFTPIMAALLNTSYQNYTTCEADTSKSYGANDKTFNPLKLTNKNEQKEDTNLLAWGEFIISQGKLKNQSPGTRTLAIIREKGVSRWPSRWHAGDKIIIKRTSSEPISIEYTNSSYFKLTTDGMVDTIEFYSNRNAFTDYEESAYLLLSIPRETYIESIEIQRVDYIYVLLSYMDGTNVWWHQYSNPANGDDVDDLKKRTSSLETSVDSLKANTKTLETSIDQLETAAGEVNVSDVDVTPNTESVDVAFKDVNYSEGDGFFSDEKTFTLPAATEEAAGVMTAEDKKKLNGINKNSSRQIGTQYCIKKRMPLVENNVLYLYKTNLPIKLGNKTLAGKKIRISLHFVINSFKMIHLSLTWGNEIGPNNRVSIGEYIDEMMSYEGNIYTFDFTNLQSILDEKQIDHCHVQLLLHGIEFEDFSQEIYKAFFVKYKGLGSDGYYEYTIDAIPVNNDMQLRKFNIVNNVCYLNDNMYGYNGFHKQFENTNFYKIKVYRGKNVKRIDLSQPDGSGYYKNSTYGKRRVSGYFISENYREKSGFWRAEQKHTLKCMIKMKGKVCTGFKFQQIVSKPVYGIFTCHYTSDKVFHANMIK